MEIRKILDTMAAEFPNVYWEAPPPKPFVGGDEIKAIVLGTDPGNCLQGRVRQFEFVFGLENSNSPYFAQIRKNIDCLTQLSMQQIYVENLCRKLL